MDLMSSRDTFSLIYERCFPTMFLLLDALLSVGPHPLTVIGKTHYEIKQCITSFKPPLRYLKELIEGRQVST